MGVPQPEKRLWLIRRAPHKTLGVARSVASDDIRHAYPKLAKLHHPDLNPGNAASEERFKKTSAANELLSDPEKHTRFDPGETDAGGQEQAQGHSYRDYADNKAGRRHSRAGPDAAEWNTEDISYMFGSMFAGGRPRADSRMRGADEHYSLTTDRAISQKKPPMALYGSAGVSWLAIRCVEVDLGAGQEGKHCIGRGAFIAGTKVFVDGSMLLICEAQRFGSIGLATMACHESLEKGALHGFEKVGQDTVAAGQSEGLMELHIRHVEGKVSRGIKTVFGHGAGRIAHGVQGGFDGGKAGAAGVAAGECHRLNLKRTSDLQKVEHAFGIGFDQRFEEGTEHCAVGLSDDSAFAARQADKAAAGKDLERFADGDAAYVEAESQFGFGGKLGTEREFVDDLFRQKIGYAASGRGKGDLANRRADRGVHHAKGVGQLCSFVNPALRA
jgi:hypothetical protein